MTNNLSSLIRNEIVRLLAPLTSSASMTNGTATLIQLVGHVGALGQDSELQAEIKRLAQLADDIAALDDDDIGSLNRISQVLDLVRNLMASIHMVESVISDPKLALRAQNLGRELTESLFALYLRSHHSRLFRTAAALAQITPAEETDPEQIVVESGTVNRLPWVRDRFHFDRMSTLIEDPLGLLNEQFLPNGMVSTQDAYLAVARLFPLLRDLAKTLDLGWIYDLARIAPEIAPSVPDSEEDGGAGPWPPEDDMLEAPDLGMFDPSDFQHDYRPRLIVYLLGDNAGLLAESRIGLIIEASSAEHPDGVRGFIMKLIGDIDWSEVRGNWQLELVADGSVPAFIIGPDGVKLISAGTPATDASAKFVVERIAEPGAPAFLLGSTNGTRVEIGAFRLSTDIELSPMRSVISVSMDAKSGALVLEGGEGDGFLNALLQGKGARVEIDFGLSLSSDHGLELKGSAGLEVHLPVQASLAGTLSIDTVYLALSARDGNVRATVAATIAAKLGPITAVIERLGLEATFTFPEEGGNLGPLDLSLGFKFPDGIGLLIDVGPITGGGFLHYEQETGRYAGALELEIYDISVKAIGLLDTKIPGGKPAYSFLILITTEFSPIPIGFGFTLNGVGGLAGIHRRMVVEELRKRFSDNSLDSILFPENPIRDAARIISDLQAVFPPAEDRYVFGPMAIIGWGTPTLLEGKLGILLELPSPMRLVLLGQFQLALPSKDKKIIEINLDVIGEIDPERQRIALDGRLRDSYVASFPIDGEMAMRLVGGDEPNFALAIGGFHPDYSPPADFPKLKRITIPIGLDDNPRLTLTGYLAFTSNTIQIGAAASLYAEAGWFNITGEVSFDALFTRSPLSFVTDFFAEVALCKGDTLLAHIKLEATLSGPTPYHVVGEACLAIKWLPDICVPFEATFGWDKPIELPLIDPWEPLLKAVKTIQNWTGVRPAGIFRGATLTQMLTTTVGPLFDPAGGVTLRQTEVPLNRRITKFAEAQPPTGSDRFDLSLDGTDWSVVEDFFAPAQFEQLSNDEKLSRPSFEQMVAGFTLAGNKVIQGEALGTVVEYETKIIDSAFETREGDHYSPTLELQVAALNTSAAARAPLRSSGPAKFSPLQAVKPLITLEKERFLVVSTVDLSQQLGVTAPTSKGAAYQALADYLAQYPAEQGRLEVFSCDELAS